MKKTFISALAVTFMLSGMASSAEAQASRSSKRKRPVRTSPIVAAQLSVTVTDAVTGAPLVNVQVAIDRTGVAAVTTNAQGVATFTGLTSGGVTVTARRGAYEMATRTVSLVGGTNQVNVGLTPHPVAKLTKTDGTVFEVDAAAMEFGFTVPFTGYTKSAKLDVCRDGQAVMYTKDQIKSINGPAIQAAAGACCSFPTAQQISITLDSGETFNAILRDSCTGYKVDVLTYRRDTGAEVFLPLTSVRTIELP